MTRTASRRNAAFFPMLSTRCTCAPSGPRPARRRSPGREIRRRTRDRPTSGLVGPAAAAAASWRCVASRPVRLSRGRNQIEPLLPVQEQGRQSDRGALVFHVKQASRPRRGRGRLKAPSGLSAPNACVRPPARLAYGRRSCRAAVRITALAPNVSDQQRQRCRGNAVDPAGLADGARPLRLQLMPHLVGKPGNAA